MSLFPIFTGCMEDNDCKNASVPFCQNGLCVGKQIIAYVQ